MSFEREHVKKTLLIENQGTKNAPKYTICRLCRVEATNGQTYLETITGDFTKSPDLWYFDAVEFTDGSAMDRSGTKGMLGLTHISSGTIERPTA